MILFYSDNAGAAVAHILQYEIIIISKYPKFISYFQNKFENIPYKITLVFDFKILHQMKKKKSSEIKFYEL